MRSTCFDEYQHAVGWHDDLFLFGGNGRVLVLAQGFFDLLLDFEQGGVQRSCLGKIRGAGYGVNHSFFVIFLNKELKII